MKRKAFFLFPVIFFLLVVSTARCQETAGVSTYTFVNNYKIETDAYTYSLNFRGIFSYNCVVLDYNIYYIDPASPVNDISFIDIAVGVDWVVDNYDRIREDIVIEWGDRFGRFYFYGGEYNLYYENVTNIHAIARHADDIDFLKTIQKGNVYEFNGYLVDVKGISSDGLTSLSWTTGDRFGDTKCEILVVGGSEIISVEPGLEPLDFSAFFWTIFLVISALAVVLVTAIVIKRR